jgi:hypothetical protein
VKHILLINPNSDTFSNPVLFKIIEELNSTKSIKLTLVLTWQTTELPDIFKDVKIINLNQINVNYPLKFWKAIPTLLSTLYLVLYSKFQKVNKIVGVDSLGFILASRVKYWIRKISVHYFSFEIFFEEELSLFPADLKVKIKEKRYGKYLDCLVIQDRHRQELLLNENNWKDFNFKTFLLPVSYPLIQLDPTKRLEYRNKLGIAESEHIIIHSGSVAPWSGGNYLVSLLKAGLGLNTKLLVHSKTKINPDNVILTELSKLSALGYPVILHDESFADYEEYLNFLQIADIGLALYFSDYMSPFNGKNIEEIGLSSGKFSCYMLAAIPTITTPNEIYKELNERYDFGGIASSTSSILFEINRIKMDDRKDNCQLLFKEQLDFSLFLGPYLNELCN